MKKDSQKLDHYAAFYSRRDDTVVLMEAIALRKQFEVKNKDFEISCHAEALPTPKPAQPNRDINENVEYDTHDFSALNQSNLVTANDLRHLSERFPAKSFMKQLDLVYSSCKHGYSLQTLYRNCNFWCESTSNCKETTPCIFIITDTNGHTFGALSSSIPAATKKKFIGNGESMLFTIRPNIEVFPWTGMNDYFSLFHHDSISFGGSSRGGNPGLWMDNNLLHGRTTRCETFGNKVLSLEEDFQIYAVEMWSFKG